MSVEARSRRLASKVSWRTSAGLLGFVLGLVFAQSAENPRLRVVLDDNYPPFVFRDDEGASKGILIDQWRLWEKQTGRAGEELMLREGQVFLQKPCATKELLQALRGCMKHRPSTHGAG